MTDLDHGAENLFRKIKKGDFNGIIRLKVVDPNYLVDMEPIGDFVTGWFNAFFSELSLFGEYFSIQEHTNRAKFIEFCEQKTYDISYFYMVCQTLKLYSSIKLYTKFKLEHYVYHKNVVGIADHLAISFNNMKTCFVPECDVTGALQARFKNVLNLKKDENLKYKEEFDELDKYMKILIFKEKYNKKHISMEISNGFLNLKSKKLFFRFKLEGTLENPYWQFDLVDTNSSKANDFILQAFSGLKHTLLEKTIEFITFYENRLVSKCILEKLTHFEGNCNNFKGFYKGVKYHGNISKSNELEIVKEYLSEKQYVLDIQKEFDLDHE